MEYINSFYCFFQRDKNIGPSKPPPTPSKEKKPLENIFCSTCFNYIKYEKQLIKRAQIKNSLFGFCTEECYIEWLNNPGTMLLGKLN